MKKLFIASLAVLFVTALLTQPAAAGVGVKGGLAWPTLAFSSSMEAPPLTTLHTPMGGVYFGIGLGIFSIQPEILYVRMGARMEETPDWMEDRLDYIQVPLLLKINVLPGPISPMVYGGPYGAYLLKATGVSYISGVTESTDIKDQVKSTDYGVTFGGGIDFKLGVKLSAEVRYNLGLANITKNPSAGEWVKNRCLMVLVGIGF